MARAARSRGQHSPQIEVLEDIVDRNTTTLTPTRSPNHHQHHLRALDVLAEISANATPSDSLAPGSPTLDDLAAGLKKLHIQSPEKLGLASAGLSNVNLPICGLPEQRQPEQIRNQAENQSPGAASHSPGHLKRERRSHRSSESLPFPVLDPLDEERASETFSTTPPPQARLSAFVHASHAIKDPRALAIASSLSPLYSDQVAKHHTATLLEDDLDPMTDDQKVLLPEREVSEQEVMAIAEPAIHIMPPTKVTEVIEMAERSHDVTSPVAPLSQLLTPSRASPPSIERIEDSVEALDRLEEELEALDAAVQIGNSIPNVALKPASSARRTSNSQSPSVRKVAQGPKRTTSTAPRTGPVRPRASTAGQPEEVEGDNGKTTDKGALRRATVARPASLLSPKPLAKSARPPTKPTFELPGAAVARRLKEQREARLSMQISPDKAAQHINATNPSPSRPKSTKVPTVPTFELPGEAISRRKREEREAKLKAQEEEERKRREFKARPMRASIVPNTFPRETIASRARQAKASQDENQSDTRTPMAAKRTSIMSGASGRLQAKGSPELRGRAGAPTGSSSQVSRATSASTGSVSGKRSTLSAEDAHHQKLRGKEIYKQDNSMTSDRERERREREHAAKVAREEAAERSRAASREWAERQRLKKAAALQAVAAKDRVEAAV